MPTSADSTPPDLASEVREYHSAPALRARLFGSLLVLVSLLVFLGSFLVVLIQLSMDLVVVLAVLLLLTIGVSGWVSRRVVLLRTDPTGYAVRFVRGVGAARGRWTDVAELTRSERVGEPCAVLRLQDGRSTTIPLRALDVSATVVLADLTGRLEAAGRR